ncbi:hypothetical protein N7509_012143 [Penicillium cosmopolitanum]|uniref:CS domain-containing protein n=1 Tax=Penicillium cosmopolitanum TaxID=1131564 RepID=A0A9W9SKP0_9EURO|nr:uncharacterized protein N7509_012143 [Penicillium cosmopolitanum]KAJ5379024.1 hypothetical protein N7509_012143 [Penicillium cosmopolitanum]
MNAAAQGDQALKDSNAPLAIQHYTRALAELPRAVNYYVQRSTAHSRVKPADGGPNSLASLRDAEIALALARERGKRELILAAQMRRGVSLFQLGRYHDAKFLFDLIESKTRTEDAPEDKSASLQAAMSGSGKNKKDAAELQIWQMQVARKLKALENPDETAVAVVEFPSDTKIPTEKEIKAELESLKTGKTAPVANESKKRDTQLSSSAAGTSAQETTQGAEENKPSTAVPEKVRHEWYQSGDSVVVTLYIKGIQKDSVQVDLKDESVSLQFPLPSGSDYDFTLDPLFAPIDPSTSKVSVMGTKIELVLQKQTAGQKWHALESSATETTVITDRPAAPSAPTPSGPAYPTSSRHGAKDWDKVASSLTSSKSKGKKKETKEEAAGDDSDAESVDSDFGGDAVDGFFKKLYAGADPDTRRAMMKSYVESQGTSLSTNWSEVGNKKMEVHES